MDAKDLENLLEKSKDKYHIFANKDIISQYKISIKELKELSGRYLSDDDKVSLLSMPHFKKSTVIQMALIEALYDSGKKVKLITNPEYLKGLTNQELVKFIEGLDPYTKKSIIYNYDFLSKKEINGYKLLDVFRTMNTKDKEEFLKNKEYVTNKLGIKDNQITNFILSLDSPEAKLKMMEEYDIDNLRKFFILETLSDEIKEDILINNKYRFDSRQYTELASTLSPKVLVKFFKEHKDELINRRIKPYKITYKMEAHDQVEFARMIDETELDINEKRKILVLLDESAKEKIYDNRLPKEYTTALKMRLMDQQRFDDVMLKIDVDFNSDLNNYKGLDELIYLNPLKIPIENRNKIIKLLKVCPDIDILDNIPSSISTAAEYIKGEKWIDSVIEGINPEWSDIEKVAYIDNVIGKNINYSPDYKTEVFEQYDTRALWKIICSKEGVCNGISQMEKYIFDRIGIKSEIIGTENHSFIKLKDISIPTKDGQKVGDTILDTTWNLTQNRYGSKPSCFCINYNQARLLDVTEEEVDTQSHFNDKELMDVSLYLDDENLRQVYKNIGIADEQGKFPIGKMLDKIDAIESSGKEAIHEVLDAIKEQCPDFATCVNETTEAVNQVIYRCNNIDYKECITNRVYSKDDKDKKAVMYLYTYLKNNEEVFFVADKKQKDFVTMDKDSFENKYKTYKMDLAKYSGKNPWEQVVKNKEER